MRTSLLFILVCNIFCQNSIAQSIHYPYASPYTVLTAYSSQQGDVFSFTANQAALAAIKQPEIGIYGERRFLLAAVSSYNVAVAYPTKKGNFGIQLNYAGFKNFNENKIGLAYGRSLGPKIDIGIQFNYYGYRIPGYDRLSAINFEAGAIIHFTDKLNGGFHVYNPVTTGLIKSGGEKLPAAYKMGIGYDASTNFFVGAEIIKQEDKPANIIAAFQYHFAKQFFVRTGFISGASSVFAGTGISWNKFRLDVTGNYHPQLGLSPAILLIAEMGNNKK